MSLSIVLLTFLALRFVLEAVGLLLDPKKRRLHRRSELKRQVEAVRQLDREAAKRFRRFRQLMAVHDAQRRNRTTVRDLGEDHRRSER